MSTCGSTAATTNWSSRPAGRWPTCSATTWATPARTWAVSTASAVPARSSSTAQPARACLIFGVQAHGASVLTVEGLADGEVLSDLQQAFSDHHALQCGFCTPGFLMLIEAYLAEADAETGPELNEALARELVASNLCRCTGYQGIVEAVLAVARARRAQDTT